MEARRGFVIALACLTLFSAQGGAVSSSSIYASRAPTGDYGNPNDMRVYHYDNSTNQLTDAGPCDSKCTDLGQNAGLTDGQCVFATDWRRPPPPEYDPGGVLTQAQYLSYGRCAAIWTEYTGNGTWYMFGRVQCKIATPGAGYTENDTYDWYFLDQNGQRYGGDSFWFNVGGGIGQACLGYSYAGGTFDGPNAAAASQFCARARTWTDGILTRNTQYMCVTT